MEDMLSTINGHMHKGQCPQSGCIGECAIICEDEPGWWWAALYIWDSEFNDSTRVAKWFHDAGAIDVRISHVLYDNDNEYRDGVSAYDSTRTWHVTFSMPNDASDAVEELEGLAA